MCPHCHSLEWDAIEASGRGTVYSFVMPHHPPLPFFETPYIVVLVELEEGVRLVTNLVDVARRRLDRRAGAGAVRRVRRRLVLPVFVPRCGMTAARTTVDGAALQVGDEIPAMVIDVTPTRVVAGAIASRDFMPVHHDRDYANQQGAPDIFMNILSDTGYCSRFLTDWAGPDAMITTARDPAGRPGVPGPHADLHGRGDRGRSATGDEASSTWSCAR